jgi:hypothetical protein
MYTRNSKLRLFLTLWLIASTLACSPSSAPGSGPDSEPPVEPTPTFTLAPVLEPPSTSSTLCEGLSGEIEIRVLVGPAEAVGLEPFAIGSIPFKVVGGGEPYMVEGGGPITYEDVLTEEWGTYAVTLNLDIELTGVCVGEAGSEQLNLELQMTGEQMLEVTAEGFHGTYPWSGTASFDLSFLVSEGEIFEGDGWAFILHPHGP